MSLLGGQIIFHSFASGISFEKILLFSFVTFGVLPLSLLEEPRVEIASEAKTFSRSELTNVTFPCVVRNLGTSVLTWYKEDQVLTADSFIVLQDGRLSVTKIGNTGYSLHLASIKKSDAGSYTCAVNTKEKILKLTHQLMINLAPRIQPLHTEEVITLKTGARIKLHCKADGHPPPSVYWTRQHNQAFAWEPHPLIVHGNVLDLNNIEREFSGEYICNADNGVGNAPAREAVQLNVLYPPHIEVKKDFYHAHLGENLSILCLVRANPPPKVTWYKETMKHFDTDRVFSRQIGDSYTLVVQNVRESDFGEYSCRAENSLLKEIGKSITVSGTPAPPVVTSPEYSSHKYSYHLTWSVISTYPVSATQLYIWTRTRVEGVEAGADTKRILVKERTMGGAAAGGPAHLLDVVEGTQKKDQSAPKGEQLPHHLSHHQYIFKGLQSNQTFGVRLRSKNQFGWGPFSDTFYFHMFPREKQPLEMKEVKEIYKVDAPLKSSTGRTATSTILVMIAMLLFLC